MKLAIVGDTHRNTEWLVNQVIPYSVSNGCSKILQVGDFGFVWEWGQEEDKLLRKLDRKLSDAGLDLHFLPGNHENHDLLADYTRRVPQGPEGHYRIRPRIHYTGRVSQWEWGGRRLAAVGGAVSIDREWRQREERVGGPKIWWPTETLNGWEVQQAHALGPVDVLFTHDAPVEFPETWIKPDLESQINRQMISSVARKLQPKLQFHGHYHCSLTYPLRHDRGMCEVRALHCDGTSREENIAILDLESSE